VLKGADCQRAHVKSRTYGLAGKTALTYSWRGTVRVRQPR
jgi:hypothetical protein